MNASTQDLESRTGRNSPSMNRLASLSDLNSVKKEDTVYIMASNKQLNFETLPSFIDHEINNKSTNAIAADRRSRASKHMQLTNKLPAPRSNSTLIGQIVKPVMDGSFIMLDERSSKLSDVGVYSRNN
mmetsp:Transcript_40043/g.52437  ORF Transcript_40043/g.52437 Transcript_40043/m.52437 type:complete len:128 (-) Transcript_40043:146-529(-)